MRCNICNTELGVPLYEARSEQSLTSLCDLKPGRVRVWLCETCGHLRGEALPDEHHYYESEYRILLNHEDEDQIYEVQEERIIYRTDHQVATLLQKLNLPNGTRLLDYGCAKASTPRRLLSVRPDLQVYLFDVSSMYLDFWRRFVSEDRVAINHIPSAWLGTFNVVTSFFALEHIQKPQDTVRQIASLLTDDGVFYGIVPDTFGNIGDFVVLDHVNHFTDYSLYFLLRSAGFTDICIDASAHRGALVFTGRKVGRHSAQPDLAATLSACRKLAAYWTKVDDCLQEAEAIFKKRPSAIYGAGFYGAYIFSRLTEPSWVQCFLDTNPFLQGKTLFGLEILPPQQVPSPIRTLYIGLNPKIARSVVAHMEWLRGRNIDIVFLEEYEP
jgi:SAM-dependent methyltransferase